MNGLTHKLYIAQGGKDLVSPVSGSMRPLIRENRDRGLFQTLNRPLRRYDVVLYESGGQTLMHRVLRVSSTVCELRGDNAQESETIPREQIFAVMTGLYRDERFISCDSVRYRIFSRLIVAFHPYIGQYRSSPRVFWRFVRKLVTSFRRPCRSDL